MLDAQYSAMSDTHVSTGSQSLPIRSLLLSRTSQHRAMPTAALVMASASARFSSGVNPIWRCAGQSQPPFVVYPASRLRVAVWVAVPYPSLPA